MEKNNKAYNILKSYVIEDSKNPIDIGYYGKGLNTIFPYEANLSENLYNELIEHPDTIIIQTVTDRNEKHDYYIIDILGYKFFIYKYDFLNKNEKEVITIDVICRRQAIRLDPKIYVEKKN